MPLIQSVQINFADFIFLFFETINFHFNFKPEMQKNHNNKKHKKNEKFTKSARSIRTVIN